MLNFFFMFSTIYALSKRIQPGTGNVFLQKCVLYNQFSNMGTIYYVIYDYSSVITAKMF